jgi:UDP-glucuronate decarboxylase
MKILVTGGSGFIGSNLCKTLVNLEHIVYCLDDFSSGNKKNIMETSNQFHIINHDIREKIDLYDIDQIYNLASPAAPNQYKKDPLKTLETNIFGTKNILDLGTKLDIPILHISTIRVFDIIHLGNNSCYTEGKRAAETLCKEYYYKYGTKVKIARLNSVYGPNMSIDDSRVIPQFIMKSIKNEHLIVCGDGSDIESFCFIDDILIALMLFMNSEYSYEPITIDGDVITVMDLAKLIIELSHSKSQIILSGESRGKNYKVYGTNIREVLNWNPTVNIKEGLKSAIKYYKGIIT